MMDAQRYQKECSVLPTKTEWDLPLFFVIGAFIAAGTLMRMYSPFLPDEQIWTVLGKALIWSGVAVLVIWNGWRVCKFFSFIRKHSLVGENAPAWALEEAHGIRAFNRLYLALRLSKRNQETVRALKADFGATLGDLVGVAKALD